MSSKGENTPVAERRGCAFEGSHPAVMLGFFVVAIVLTMCLRHPAFLVAALVCSALLYASVRGRACLRTLAGMLAVLAAVAAVNPLFNTRGASVLLTCPWGAPYTLEALGYGLAIGAMFVAMLLWFGSYNHLMSSDKFTYLFGSFAPALSLAFTLVLRLVPAYQRKAAELAGARACAGLAPSEGSFPLRVRHGSELLSALASWAFENGIVSADSMNSRGYGCAKRSSYARYRFMGRDAALAAVLAVLGLFAVTGSALGGLWVNYYPVFSMSGPTFWSVTGLVAYTLFLLVPTMLNVLASIQWRISLSRI